MVLQTPITLASGAVILTGQLNALEDGSLLRDFQVTLQPPGQYVRLCDHRSDLIPLDISDILFDFWQKGAPYGASFCPFPVPCGIFSPLPS